MGLDASDANLSFNHLKSKTSISLDAMWKTVTPLQLNGHWPCCCAVFPFPPLPVQYLILRVSKVKDSAPETFVV